MKFTHYGKTYLVPRPSGAQLRVWAGKMIRVEGETGDRLRLIYEAGVAEGIKARAMQEQGIGAKLEAALLGKTP